MLKSSQYSIPDLIKTFLGASFSIVVLLYMTQISQQIWIMAPFGATCVLLYAVAKSPLAQPKNVIVGHVVSAAIGLVFVQYLPINMWSTACAVALAIVAMQWLDCVHPPAGADPLLILLTAGSMHYTWMFLIFPVLTGAVLLVVIARCVDRFQQFLKKSLQARKASPSL